ncbi:acetolactate decarboxylase [Salibacteraceae bacterium]|nr:acetolactate decarboxylase [Salibacteraceae bacterium]
MKYKLLSFSIFVLLSIEIYSQNDEGFQVEHKGALKNIMHKGDLSAQADLLDFENTENLFAIGAVENLKGEILILDGEPYISSVEDSEMSISHTLDHKAALLVYATVANWKEHEIPDSIVTYLELEKYVVQIAKTNGINTDEPFPFMLSGTAKSIDWHIIDWEDGDTEHSHQKHIESGLHGTETNQDVQILGFYSKSHHAVFTHHTTNMHLHVKTTDDKISGHLDGLQLGKQMRIMLPQVN